MKMRLFVLVFFLALYCGRACSCRRSTPITKQKYADHVFTGKVIDIKEIKTKEKISGLDQPKEFTKYEFTFQVLHFHKGKKEIQGTEEIKIISTGGGADCGIYFIKNKKYLVYASKQEHKIHLGLQHQKADKEYLAAQMCSGTKRIRAFTFLEQLILEIT